MTVVTVVVEAQGFDNFTRLKQLNSYAGYDIQIKESSKFTGRTRISKKGNNHIKRALYMPSLSVIRYIHIKEFTIDFTKKKVMD